MEMKNFNKEKIAQIMMHNTYVRKSSKNVLFSGLFINQN